MEFVDGFLWIFGSQSELYLGTKDCPFGGLQGRLPAKVDRLVLNPVKRFCQQSRILVDVACREMEMF